jgi:2-C-methyl-D-erythritol 2,4-cyclodiphosphate synthase
MLKVGMGYDVHRLVADRKLFLGGVEIPHDKGLKGHSDGDALVHAMIDAILGACNLGDIGTHFPDTSPEYEGVSGCELLSKTRKIVEERGRIEHIDSTVVAEAPRLEDHIPAMKERIAEALGIRPENVSIKAKTAEGLGAVGRGEAIEAHAVAMVDL